jgi:hypothetical protein
MVLGTSVVPGLCQCVRALSPADDWMPPAHRVASDVGDERKRCPVWDRSSLPVNAARPPEGLAECEGRGSAAGVPPIRKAPHDKPFAVDEGLRQIDRVGRANAGAC